MSDNAAGTVRDDGRAADRAAIHEVLIEYGRTIDNRDWDGLAALFGEDGVYVAGSGDGVKGAEVGPLMAGIFEKNPSNWRQPNFHIFFNETIRFTGPDTASAQSNSLFVVPGDEGGFAQIGIIGEYFDEMVLKGGRWYFARREVKGHVHARHYK
jgi:uncharacterized protein (TIGR02246 family)